MRLQGFFVACLCLIGPLKRWMFWFDLIAGKGFIKQQVTVMSFLRQRGPMQSVPGKRRGSWSSRAPPHVLRMRG